MAKALWFLTLIVPILGRLSPNAHLVDQLMESSMGERYSDDVITDALLDGPGLIAKYGYPVEVHHVVTEDGYIIELHRIPHGRDNNNTPGNRTPVFVMHGMYSSSADFVTAGPGDALGYLLAEEGYDVWFGNARGNYYSRNHTSISPSDQQFWEFSWDEIGYYDLAASIDHVLEVTGAERMHYVGHSQGGTAFLVLTSLRPEYNDKFISFQGLAPASFFEFCDNRLFLALAPSEKAIENVIFSISSGEFLGGVYDVATFIGLLPLAFCREESFFRPLCVYANTIGQSLSSYNTTMLPVYLGHLPGGGSIRQLAHYGQSIRYKEFKRYDRGLFANMQAYDHFQPPLYNMSLITTNSYLHYTRADTLVNYRDMYTLNDLLPNSRLLRVPRDSFTHADFLWAMDLKETFHGVFIDSLRDAETYL